jgi:hypothetical protein
VELLSIVDPTKGNPAIDTSVFLDTAGDNAWTSSAVSGAPGNTWIVEFFSGGSTYTSPTMRLGQVMRCIR